MIQDQNASEFVLAALTQIKPEQYGWVSELTYAFDDGYDFDRLWVSQWKYIAQYKTNLMPERTAMLLPEAVPLIQASGLDYDWVSQGFGILQALVRPFFKESIKEKFHAGKPGAEKNHYHQEDWNAAKQAAWQAHAKKSLNSQYEEAVGRYLTNLLDVLRMQKLSFEQQKALVDAFETIGGSKGKLASLAGHALMMKCRTADSDFLSHLSNAADVAKSLDTCGGLATALKSIDSLYTDKRADLYPEQKKILLSEAAKTLTKRATALQGYLEVQEAVAALPKGKRGMRTELADKIGPLWSNLVKSLVAEGTPDQIAAFAKVVAAQRQQDELLGALVKAKASAQIIATASAAMVARP